MDLPLTIAADYLPAWGVTEGLRELLQNWLDATATTGSESAPTFSRGALTLTNPGATLDRSVLLIGRSSKRGVEGQRGQFGEGLKIGTLALVRAGKKVTVYTGTERWSFRLAPSTALGGATVLVCEIEEGVTRPCVSVVVGNLTRPEWTAARSLFRCFDAREPLYSNAYDGALLADETGAIYVKGIRVGTEPGCRFGYDFASVDVDRDRKMVRDFDLAWHASRLVGGALAAGKLSAATVFRMAAEGAKDAAYIESALTGQPAARTALADAFRAAHGPLTVPCATQDDVQTCVNLSRHGVLLPSSLVAVLAPSTGTVHDLQAEMRDNVVARHDETDLTDPELAAFAWAMEHARLAFGADGVRVDVVTYSDPKTLGMFRGALRPVEVARHVLADRVETLATILHEVAHLFAGDGEAAHTAHIERAWTTLARRWSS